MPNVKMLGPSYFAKMQKELTATVELVRSKQDEKQAVIDQFNAESKRFFFGKISERALMSSVKKTNKELQRLDTAIRNAIAKAKNISDRERKYVAAQAPIIYKAKISGIVGGAVKVKKKKTAKKKVTKKKITRKVTKKNVVKKKKAVKKKVKRKVSTKKRR